MQNPSDFCELFGSGVGERHDDGLLEFRATAYAGPCVDSRAKLLTVVESLEKGSREISRMESKNDMRYL